MITYNLDNKDKALYLQLYENLKNDILSGKLNPFEKLPSKRKFANHLGVALITVENAYEQLIAEGYVTSKEKKGYYVCDFIDTNLHLIKEKPNLTFDNNEKALPSYYDLLSQDVDSSLFPFSIWSKLMRQVISKEDKKLLMKIKGSGLYDLRVAISNHLYSFNGVLIDPKQIIIGAGSEYLYSMIIRILGFQKVYALENPGYRKIDKIYSSNSISTRYVPLDEKGLDVRYLEGVDVVHISPAHQFPTGIIMPISRRLELLKWAAESEDRYIIEDDYDSEFRFKGIAVPPIMSIDKNEKVIYMNTFSKTIAPSIRISYMIIPKKLLPIFKDKLEFYSCAVPSFEQYTLTRFINEGYYERHLNRMKNYYRKKRDLFFSLIKESSLDNIASCQYTESGLHFLLKLKTDIPDDTLIALALKEGVKLSCLSQYYFNNKNKKEHYLVINYSSIAEKDLINVVKILEKILV